MKKNKEIAKMNVNIESEICSYCHLAQERIKTDVSNSKLLYALENQISTTVHAYRSMIHTLGI